MEIKNPHCIIRRDNEKKKDLLLEEHNKCQKMEQLVHCFQGKLTPECYTQPNE